MKVTLFIPTFNEAPGMKVIMPRVKREWYDQLIIMDGGSTDGTVEYANKNGYLLLGQKTKGLRHAYVEALEHITGDIVITLSPDGNCIPELIPSLVEKMKQGYDMVIVSRYARGAKSYDDDAITAFGNKMFTTVVNLLFGAKYTDVLGIYRAWKRDLFFTLDLDKDESYSWEEAIFATKIGIEPLMSARCAKRRLKVAEIPGDEPPRIGGKRKLQILRWGAAYLTQVLRERFSWR